MGPGAEFGRILRLKASGESRNSHSVGYDTESWSAMRATRPPGTPKRAFLGEFRNITALNSRWRPAATANGPSKPLFSKELIDPSVPVEL